jgi:two-component system NtrC family sensor kinase
MFRHNLKLKVSLYLALAMLPVMALLPWLLVKHQQEHLQAEISRHVTQVAELIVKSTRYAMMINQREIAEKIIEDIGRQTGIDRVRVLTADGTIIHSNKRAETGYSIDQQDEPCVACHKTSQPLDHVADDKRWRITQAEGDHRVLAAMEPIRNEPTCANASCHEHPARQKVLGVVDIAYSLDEMDQTLHRQAIFIYGVSGLIVLVVAVGVGLLLQRFIYVPLRDLDSGAQRIAEGELDHHIPVRSDDEFGHVATSFNHMGTALRGSMHELHDLVETLEQKVEERSAALRAAQAEVAQGEKLASIGLLASGIAHELNNPLTGVLTFTSLLRRKMPDGSDDAEDLDLVISETRRCASIIRRLLDFAREKVPTQAHIDLNVLIGDVVRFIDRPATLQDVEITTHFDPALPQVWCDPDLIKQVVLNILVNATQAIEGAGQVRVTTRVTTRVADPAEPLTQRHVVPCVEFAVSDTGCGIPEANLQRIFDPFFTSKEVGKGTGLGLSVSYGIVRSHGGSIKVESTVGEGTTFRVQLPTQPPPAEPSAADPSPPLAVATATSAQP